VTAVEHVLRESPLAITVVQSLCTGDKMDWVIQKATELGAAVIVPLAAARSVLKLEGVRATKRVAHWATIAQAATGQSGRTLVPRIRPIQTLHEVIDEWRQSPSPKTAVYLDPFAGQGLSEAEISGPITLMIGPEAGWSDDEEALMQRAGFRGVRCGPRILRTETAALVALTALAIRAGEF
jgi:16S rRNA (uracil1498-N3)-methyltransferase